MIPGVVASETAKSLNLVYFRLLIESDKLTDEYKVGVVRSKYFMLTIWSASWRKRIVGLIAHAVTSVRKEYKKT
jgi:hypothetical protein